MNESTGSIILSPRLLAVGDPAGEALENINTNVLGDGVLCYVSSGAGQGEWQLEKGATDAPNGTTIVAPISGPGRWFKKLSPGLTPTGGLETRVFEVTLNPTSAGSFTNIFAPWPEFSEGDLAVVNVMLAIPGTILCNVRSDANGVRFQFFCVDEIPIEFPVPCTIARIPFSL